MKITRLILVNYKRLMLSNIRYFEWTPERDILLLLGSNGSGKSSVLEELTPCPAAKDQFEAGGVKEFHCTHNHHSYVLKSTYGGTGTGKHSFIEDGVTEMNPGGTFAVQKDLVLKQFGMDRAIHEILIGLTPFTGMTTAKRREWLTRMSPIDLTYAFSRFNSVKSHLSDARGVINHKAKRMANEHIDLPSDAEMNGYRTQIHALTERLQQLYRTRGNEPIGRGNVIDFNARYNDIRRRAKRQLETQPNEAVLYGIRSRSDLEGQIQVADHRAQMTKSVMEELAQELDEIQRQKVPESDFGTPEQIRDLEKELHQLEEQLLLWGGWMNGYSNEWPIVHHEVLPHSKGVLDEMMSSWVNLIQEFPVNQDDRFNHQAGTEKRLRFAENKTRLQSLGDRHSAATQRLAQMRGCAEVVCPDCTHSFVPGQSPSEVLLAEARCKELHETIVAIETEQEQLKEYIDHYDDYLTYVNRFRVLVRQYDQYKPVWETAVQRRMMFTEPRKHLTDVIRWQQAQDTYIKLMTTQMRVDQIKQTLKRYAEADLGHADFLRKHQEALETKIHNVADERIRVEQVGNSLRYVVQKVDRYGRDLTAIQSELQDYMQQVNTQIVDLVKQGFDEEIKHTSLRLSDLQTNLHRFEMRENTLKDIEREHNEAKQWHGDLGLLSKAMSPTGGLIGRYLNGFMQNVVKLVNAVIDEIWTYPLEVLPSKVDNDELDYYFPLSVRDGAVMAPDIARGSSSQRDIVNFGFKLILMKFLGLEEWPLYLDEFANTFDEQHRQNTIPFLLKMIEMGQVSQLIYISHFSSTHGAFNNAEVVVLDPTNITVPTVYNRTVKIA
jgi:DNA repair exonuclease SbcCD ATPase subunit